MNLVAFSPMKRVVVVVVGLSGTSAPVAIHTYLPVKEHVHSMIKGTCKIVIQFGRCQWLIKRLNLGLKYQGHHPVYHRKCTLGKTPHI
jgi:hypothetical protein